MKLGETISWLIGNLQRSLFPKLEECWNTAFTEKERQLVYLLELIQVERFVPESSAHQWFDRRLRERESIARSFVAKAVYGYPFTRSLIEQLKTSTNLRVCGFERVSDIPCEANFSRAFREVAESGLGDRVHGALLERTLETVLVSRLDSHRRTRETGNETAKSEACSRKEGTTGPGRTLGTQGAETFGAAV